MFSGGSLASASVTWSARIVNVQWSALMNGAVVVIVNTDDGLLLTPMVLVPWTVQDSETALPVSAPCSVNLTLRPVSTGTLIAPLAGVVDWTVGAWSAPLVIEMSSMPTHSSLPTALAVMIRTWTSGWLSTAAGNWTST